MQSIDAAFERASALIQDATARIDDIVTEEDAKLQLIVRFVTEVLDWAHGDISAERKNENGYSDYIVSQNGKPAFLIEAKRKGAIGIATSATTRQTYKISGPALQPSLKGIEQAASYCNPEGIPLAIVTDGITWIIFKPYISNESYKSKEAIVFPGLEAIKSAFAEFFELAGRDGYSNALYKLRFDTIHNNRTALTKPLRAPFGGGDIHPEQKSSISFDLDKIFNTFFSSLTGENDPDLLIECFVETKESRVADFALEKLTTNVLGNIDPDLRIETGLHKLIAETLADQEGDTVFIVGPSGAGKTTFLERFFKKTLPKAIAERCVVININMLDATGDADAVGVWVTNEIIRNLESQLYETGYPNWDQLLGLYHGEYVRRSNGADAQLYKQDKDAFRVKFGQYMEEQVERDREGYLRRMLKDVVINRKRLPIFLIDNTDEFALPFQQSLFQYFQALRRHVIYCLLIFPATDRSAWSFSKTEIFNIYSSKSYFLPTPSPREVFRKRVEYLKGKLAPGGSRTKGFYSLGTGIKVSIENLEAFASAVEDIFVEQDYVSNRIGALANYNIRKTLSLSRRIITSAALDIEELLKSYLLGNRSTLAPDKFVRALMLGDLTFYRKSDAHYIFPMFDVDREVPQSPLINVRVLALLKSVHDGGAKDDARYLDISSITHYFDSMDFADVAVERCLAALLSAGLIEPYDPSLGTLATAQSVAITHSGIAHLELALFNPTFFEQLALTSSIANPEVANEIRAEFLAADAPDVRLRKVRAKFGAYLISEDSSFGHTPASDTYDIQRAVLEDVRKFADGTVDTGLAKRNATSLGAQVGLVAERVNAVVDWFDFRKGYGFVTLEHPHESAFLHASVLEKAGLIDVFDGDGLVVDVSRSTKGIAISKVHEKVLNPGGKDESYLAIIIRLFEDRGYGFVHVPELEKDAFFHFSAISAMDPNYLDMGLKMKVEISADPRGRGLQVRKVISVSDA